MAWLRATIEGELAAAQVAPPGPWEVMPTDYPDSGLSIIGLPLHGSSKDWLIASPGYDKGGVWLDADAQHIALHDPQDTIARCGAELAELDMLEAMPHYTCDDPFYACHMANPDFWVDPTCSCYRDAFVDRALRIKAYGYRRRSGWREEWRP